MKTGFQVKTVLVPLLIVIGTLMACNFPSLFTAEAEQSGDILPQSAQPVVQVTSEPMEPLSLDMQVNCSLFVAPEGNDSGSGSEEQPWASFEYAAETAQPGDTVCFRGGTYRMEETRLARSGTADAPITFAAYPNEKPVLDGGGSANELLVLNGGVSYLRISGFTLRNFRVWGIELAGGNRYIHLDHLEVEGGETSIRFTYGETSEGPPAEGPVEYITLEDSIIHGSQYSAVDCTPGPCNYMTVRRLEIFNTGMTGEAFYGSDGLEFARGHHILVEDCYVHDNGGDGIDLGSRDRGGNMEGIIVRRNRVVRNHLNGIKVWAGGRIENNIIWGQGNSAIWSGTYDCTIEIINNTVAYNMWDRSYSERNWAVVVGYPEEIPKPLVNLTMVNNIIAFNSDPLDGGATGVYLGAGVQLSEHHNLYFSNDGEEITAEFISGHDIAFSREEITNGVWASFSGGGAGNLTTDPMFVSGWPEVDLRLQPGSPALNAGAPDLAPTEDGLSNPRDSQPDIGAYER